MEGRYWWMFVCATAPISWGATYFVTRNLLPADAPLWSAALRALPAGLLLLTAARRRPRGAWWGKGIVLGTLNFGALFVLVYVAAQLLPTSVAASVMALAPVMLAMLAWPLLCERPAAYLMVAATLGVTGVALLVGLGSNGAHPLGVVASFVALTLSSLGSILTTRWRDDEPLVATTSWQLIAGGAVLLVVAVSVEGPPPPMTLLSAGAYAAIAVVATALAYLCWFAGLRHLPAGTVGIIGLLNPVTGVVCGVLFGHEMLAATQWVGMGLVATAIGFGRRSGPRTRPWLAWRREVEVPLVQRTDSAGLIGQCRVDGSPS